MKILKELIDEVSFPEVWDYLAKEDKYIAEEEDPNHYRSVFEKLERMHPVLRDDLMIEITEEKQDCRWWKKEGEPTLAGWDVRGINDEGERCALDFVCWNEWLGFGIEEKILNSLKPHEIVAHCLYEMTYYGWDEQQIERVYEELEEISQANSFYEESNMTKDEPRRGHVKEDDAMAPLFALSGVLKRYEEFVQERNWPAIRRAEFHKSLDYIKKRYGDEEAMDKYYKSEKQIQEVYSFYAN